MDTLNALASPYHWLVTSNSNKINCESVNGRNSLSSLAMANECKVMTCFTSPKIPITYGMWTGGHVYVCSTAI